MVYGRVEVGLVSCAGVASGVGLVPGFGVGRVSAVVCVGCGFRAGRVSFVGRAAGRSFVAGRVWLAVRGLPPFAGTARCNSVTEATGLAVAAYAGRP